jgi:hypothetical protein
LTTQFESILTSFELEKAKIAPKIDINVSPFVDWDPGKGKEFREWLDSLPIFNEVLEKEQEELNKKLNQSISASSEEGLTALKAQYDLLSQLKDQLGKFEASCSEINMNNLIVQKGSLTAKEITVKELSLMVFPSGVEYEAQNLLIQKAVELFDFENPTANVDRCPLCRQIITDEVVVLFKKYYEHINSKIQKEIIELQEVFSSSLDKLKTIKKFVLQDFHSCDGILPNNFVFELSLIIDAIKDSTPTDINNITTECVQNFNKKNGLSIYITTLDKLIEALDSTIKMGSESHDSLIVKIEKYKRRISEIEELKTINEYKNKFIAICDLADTYNLHKELIENIDFTTILRNMSIKGKETHSHLVLGEFEQKLSHEYQMLCGKTLYQMGVKLNSRGSQQEIIVTPSSGDSPISRVLSEGEQKIHSIAMFLCEISAFPHPVIVLDDPVTSFDYNYVSNFCERLRDLINTQSSTQVIILTHNWDFFANMQIVLNRSNLNSKLSVQVLEDCCTVSEYSEKWDELCMQIDPFLSLQNEPSQEQKERLSALLRRLIERMLNAYVFNEQRHQFKVKSLTISDFQSYTRIVALTAQEAADLRDLYANLSPAEHDDIRNFYTSKSKTQFQVWYDAIKNMKTSIEGRRP